MEAPKKIYINPLPNPSDGYVGIAWNEPHKTMVEYIRKEALIEKAQKWIEENICEYCEGENIIFTINNTQYIDILNQQQFIEDFKKYMEE